MEIGGASGVQSIYGIDVAFHENGLNYGSKEETISRLLKKMIRTAMAIHGYFNLNASNSVSDTSELFMRSIQMYNLFVNDKQTIGLTKNTVRAKKTPADFKGSEVINIGAFVRSSFERLIANDALTVQEIERLQRLDYAKRTFNITYPVLKKVDSAISMTEQRGERCRQI